MPYSARDDARPPCARRAGAMIALTLAEIASAVGGTPAPRRHGCRGRHGRRRHRRRPTRVRSRPATCSSPSPASSTDGHLFAAGGRRAGAALLVVEHELELAVPQIVVADTRRRARRARDRGRRAGPRGRRPAASSASPDRTARPRRRTCCAPCSSATARRSRRAARSTTRSARPITMLERRPTTPRYLVVEMGASGVGEIARLVRDGPTRRRRRAQGRPRPRRRVRRHRADRQRRSPRW